MYQVIILEYWGEETSTVYFGENALMFYRSIRFLFQFVEVGMTLDLLLIGVFLSQDSFCKRHSANTCFIVLMEFN